MCRGRDSSRGWVDFHLLRAKVRMLRLPSFVWDRGLCKQCHQGDCRDPLTPAAPGRMQQGMEDTHLSSEGHLRPGQGSLRLAPSKEAKREQGDEEEASEEHPGGRTLPTPAETRADLTPSDKHRKICRLKFEYLVQI
ncbi:hypothetical protein Nepgr_033681 [Nepenthes gracilis]|uniref:Uncharacterized protein n=1 Tax=Nepenthes gracilis TaxID=150966 RepID=A0AAD3TLW0_NEPGR|nr:hypothetical protein Nepgr_033681 [Nepenthes gracilis]